MDRDGIGIGWGWDRDGMRIGVGMRMVWGMVTLVSDQMWCDGKGFGAMGWGGKGAHFIIPRRQAAGCGPGSAAARRGVACGRAKHHISSSSQKYSTRLHLLAKRGEVVRGDREERSWVEVVGSGHRERSWVVVIGRGRG